MAAGHLKASFSALLAVALGAASAPIGAVDTTEKAPDLVDGLVVQAVTPGPPWWKVTRGASTLWILGIPPYLPQAQAWDQKPLQRRLTGATSLLLAPILSPQPQDKSRWIVQQCICIFRVDPNRPLGPPVVLFNKQTISGYEGHQPNGSIRVAKGGDFIGYSGSTFATPPRDGTDQQGSPGHQVADLEPAMRVKLNAVLPELVRDNSGYETWSLSYTAERLTEALLVKAGVRDFKILPGELAAAAARVKTPVKMLNIGPDQISGAYLSGPPQPQIACLDWTLAATQAGPDPLRKGFAAWAKGDLPNATALLGCPSFHLPLYRQEVAAAVPALAAMLSRPGKSVAALELIPLLMQDGVISQLQAAGYQIQSPDMTVMKE